ncbi:hypothetical protein [Arenibaculum pallidiluteum]|uniref:hypothetical protein n=1 Tax=Arenibaculum pallidiluteum TaxID=2812559 RepID=UPI001A95F606|nr:hypothetical protein [Arenibaculum pallidiluteum]
MFRSTAAFERVIAVSVARVKPPEQQKEHARIAKQGLAEHLAKLDAKPEVVRLVDGRKGVAEESVKPYGVIRYEFLRLAEIAQRALVLARELSPKRSGRYAKSWFVMSGGREVPETEIPSGVELVITNDQPYHRRIVTGGQRGEVRVPPGIVETMRQRLYAEFGRTFFAEVRFIDLAGAYRLKRDHRRRGRRKGDPITYPALILRTL